MKLVWIAQDLHIGGGQRVICELSRVLTARGHRVAIIYPRGRGGFSVPPEVAVRPCGFEVHSPLVSLTVNVPAAVAAVPVCDWVLGSMPISALTAFAAGKLRGARVLYYIMNDEYSLFDDRSLLRSNQLLKLYHKITDFAHRLPVNIAVNSRWTGTRVRRDSENGFPMVHHGVDGGKFTPTGDTMKRDARFVIAVVGRRHRWKGLDDAVQALNRLVGESEVPEFELWVITQDHLNLSTAGFPVKIIKPRGDDEIASLYRTADLLVHPSWFEGFGLPPLEAMACGTPTVITDSGGVLEYARDGENCLLTPARDPEALAAAIRTLMGDEPLRLRFRTNGLKTAAEFTWEHAADQLEAILEDSL